ARQILNRFSTQRTRKEEPREEQSGSKARKEEKRGQAAADSMTDCQSKRSAAGSGAVGREEVGTFCARHADSRKALGGVPWVRDFAGCFGDFAGTSADCGRDSFARWIRDAGIARAGAGDGKFCSAANWRTGNGGAVADLLKQGAQKKTLGYAALGGSGWALALVKGILCNWMVTIGAVLALVSRSTVGKIAAMWLPILTFFALGFEHSVVNMYILPSGMMLGAAISVRQVLFWNLLPVTLGNIVAGALFTGMALYATYAAKAAPTV